MQKPEPKDFNLKPQYIEPDYLRSLAIEKQGAGLGTLLLVLGFVLGMPLVYGVLYAIFGDQVDNVKIGSGLIVGLAFFMVSFQKKVDAWWFSRDTHQQWIERKVAKLRAGRLGRKITRFEKAMNDYQQRKESDIA